MVDCVLRHQDYLSVVSSRDSSHPSMGFWRRYSICSTCIYTKTLQLRGARGLVHRPIANISLCVPEGPRGGGRLLPLPLTRRFFVLMPPPPAENGMTTLRVRACLDKNFSSCLLPLSHPKFANPKLKFEFFVWGVFQSLTKTFNKTGTFFIIFWVLPWASLAKLGRGFG